MTYIRPVVCSLLLLSLLNGCQRYDVRKGNSGETIVVDRLTGQASLIVGNQRIPIEDPKNSTSDGIQITTELPPIPIKDEGFTVFLKTRPTQSGGYVEYVFLLKYLNRESGLKFAKAKKGFHCTLYDEGGFSLGEITVDYNSFKIREVGTSNEPKIELHSEGLIPCSHPNKVKTWESAYY